MSRWRSCGGPRAPATRMSGTRVLAGRHPAGGTGRQLWLARSRRAAGAVSSDRVGVCPAALSPGLVPWSVPKVGGTRPGVPALPTLLGRHPVRLHLPGVLTNVALCMARAHVVTVSSSSSGRSCSPLGLCCLPLSPGPDPWLLPCHGRAVGLPGPGLPCPLLPSDSDIKLRLCPPCLALPSPWSDADPVVQRSSSRASLEHVPPGDCRFQM